MDEIIKLKSEAYDLICELEKVLNQQKQIQQQLNIIRPSIEAAIKKAEEPKNDQV